LSIQKNKQEFSPIKAKILSYLDFKGVTRYKFYKETGITRGILDQNNGIAEDNLLKFVNYAQDISLDWLFYNKGEMLRGDPTLQQGEGVKVENNFYKSLYLSKDHEVRQLNREVGKLQAEIDRLNKFGRGYNMAAEP